MSGQTELTKIETVSFVPYQDVKEESLMWTLKRNVVKLEARRTVSSDTFNKQDIGGRIFADILDELYDFCNANCKGIWTYTYSSYLDESSSPAPNYYYSAMPTTLLMRGNMEVFFEFREDRELFMKNKILMMKLSAE